MTYRDARFVYSIIPWDSQYLQNTTVEIKEFSFTTKREAARLLNRLLKALSFAKGDLLFFKASPLEVPVLRILNSLGFYVVEESVEIAFDLSGWEPRAFGEYRRREYRLIPATQTYLAAMKKIAQTAFTADRYHLDKNISARGADRRYAGWVETSMKGHDEVFAFVDRSDRVCGFFIIAKHRGSTNLRLAAIDPALVGKGIGRLLYFLMFRMLKKRGDTMMSTQISLSNTPVVNVYTYLVHPKITRLSVVLHYML